MGFLRRDGFLSTPNVDDPSFNVNTPEANTDAYPVQDQAADTLADRPSIYPALARTPLDPSGFLSDILAVLLGSYSGKGRPEQINISPGFGSVASQLKSHVRYHVTGIKGSNGAAGHIVDIKVGTEVIETIYNFLGAAYAMPASFWIDRSMDVTAVERSSAVNFTVILIASEAD